jgi:hypothetical protein
MSIDSNVYRKLSDLTLFLKIQNDEEFFLSDVPRLVPLRWSHFRDNWEFFREDVRSRVNLSREPDYIESQIKDMDRFIEVQRSSVKKINPFSSEAVLFRFYGVFDNVPVNSIETTNNEQEIVEAEVARVSRFNRNDFLAMREIFIESRDKRFDEIGLTDSDYNKAKNRASVPQQTSPTIRDLVRLQQIQNAIKAIDFILANIFSLDTAFVDPFALARSNANNPEIDISDYSSGRLVRLNYGESLQDVARRYLGDPDKWIDVAIANGLKPPYIDEVGEKLFLISNGEGNKININPTDAAGNLNIDKLFINQIVLLQSDTESFPEQRNVVNIYEVPVSGEIVLELDGKDDLERYKTIESAHIRIYKPNTVNSSFFVLIPSQEPQEDDRNERTPFFLEGKREDEKRAKVDIALSDSNDLIFTPNGDLSLSFGLANAVQAIKIKMSVKAGSLKRHPEFGLIDVVGNSNANVDQIRAILSESINEQIALDQRFDAVERIDIRYGVQEGENGVAAYLIQLSVRMAGNEQTIPISFTVAL